MANPKTGSQDGTNPYSKLPPKAFWRSGVAQRGPLQIARLWHPKSDLKKGERVITAGSCFAQHIGRALKRRGYSWYDAEPAPPMLTPASASAFHYGVFSFRTGNIYTAALLDQWTDWALSGSHGTDELWEQDGRFYDPLRPQIEPDGFASADEMVASRTRTLGAIRHAVETANVFVFTLGLTEAWRNKDTGLVYATCPGTIAGRFDADAHEFVNFTYPEVMEAMERTIARVRAANPDIRFLLTVSPVPLTATAEPNAHVLTATSYSKSVLRAVAGDLAARHDFVDYFPSYEIITAFPFRAMSFEPNLRSVDPKGVEFVMNHFFDDMAHRFGPAKNAPKPKKAEAPAEATAEEDDPVCEDAVLEYYNAN